FRPMLMFAPVLIDWWIASRRGSSRDCIGSFLHACAFMPCDAQGRRCDCALTSAGDVLESKIAFTISPDDRIVDEMARRERSGHGRQDTGGLQHCRPEGNGAQASA